MKLEIHSSPYLSTRASAPPKQGCRVQLQHVSNADKKASVAWKDVASMPAFRADPDNHELPPINDNPESAEQILSALLALGTPIRALELDAIDDENFETELEVIKQLPDLESLSLRFSPTVSWKTTYAFVAVALENGIGKLALNQANFNTEDEAEDFFPSIVDKLEQFEGLAFSDCLGLGNAEIKKLGKALSANNSLKELAIGEISLKKSTISSLLSCLQVNKGVEQLTLRSCGQVSGSEVAKLMQHNSSLTQLSLIDNHIGEAGAKRIAGALRENTTLTQLILNNDFHSEHFEDIFDSVGDGAAVAFAKVLAEHNRSVRYLGLAGNKIGDKGAKALAQMLGQNHHLKSLDLSFQHSLAPTTGIKNVGVQALRDALLDEDCGLQRLNLAGNFACPKTLGDFATVIKTNKTLQKLIITFDVPLFGTLFQKDHGVDKRALADMLQKLDKAKEKRANPELQVLYGQMACMVS